jgi:hypothetical protein
MSDEKHEDQPLARTRHFKQFANFIDHLIGQAQSKGAFDQLAGQGRPLDTSDDLLVPAEDRLAYRMLKSHGFAPPWVEARQDIERERRQVELWLQRTNRAWPTMHSASRTTARVEYKRMLQDLRSMILNYNLSAPPAAGQVDGLDLATELARLGEYAPGSPML